MRKLVALSVQRQSSLLTINAVEPGNIITEGFEAMGAEHVEQLARAIPLLYRRVKRAHFWLLP